MNLTLLTIGLILLVILVNGWTDAPNAIVSVVATGTLTYSQAVGMAALCNLAGVGVMTLFCPSVADTITSLVDFGTGDPTASLLALCSAMASIVIFSTAAWLFGIPTSESHSLIAALGGAALAVAPGRGMNLGTFWGILGGMAGSTLVGFLLGYLLVRLVSLGRLEEHTHWFRRGQLVSGGVMAFLHGAQDGQKFIAVFVIGELLTKGEYHTGPIPLAGHLPVVFLCAATMGLGTLLGGGRIIDKMGRKMVRLDQAAGCCSDLGGAVCLLGASLLGLPVSTTHTKASALLGAGLARNPKKVDWSIAGEMAAVWLVTFPVCGAMGYLLARLLLGLG